MTAESASKIDSKAETNRKPLVVEKEGLLFAVIEWHDIDGTANNEAVPEYERLTTLTPASEATCALEMIGIATAPITSRSFGETQLYHSILGGTGNPICEDGAVIGVPASFKSKNLSELHGATVTHHERHLAFVLSRLDRSTLTEFIHDAQKRILDKYPDEKELVSTLTSTAEQLREVAGHHSLEMARASADRIASGYIAGVTARQRTVILEIAQERGIRAFGEIINLNDVSVNKSHALEFVAGHPNVFAGGQSVQGVIPIIFGNHKNDLPLFEVAHRLGGIPIMVGHPDGGFFVREADIPDYVVKVSQPYGFGMQAAVPLIKNILNETFKLSLT